MADWFHSALKTCTHVCDFSDIKASSQQDFFCCDSMRGKLSEPRKVLLVSCFVSFTGSFYGSNRNVRGQFQLGMQQDDGVVRPIGYIPIGGYLYHDDYGYYQGEKTFNLDIESDYLKPDEDFWKRFTINIVNDKGLDDRCDVKCYVVHTMRIKV
uniref:Putative nuclear shuttle protein n=1 Tax=Subterranean clover stunt virus TaxID=36772 RepID=A0A345G0H4_SCSV|nr:putative nuclear shuttle protein [Subterranean clover stunt virus]